MAGAIGQAVTLFIRQVSSLERRNCRMPSQSHSRPSDYVLIENTKSYVKKQLRRQGVSTELLNAWEQFYYRYDPLVNRYARNCGVPSPEIVEAVQEAWLSIIQALPSFECNPDRGRFRTWLYYLVRRTMVNQFRLDLRSIDLEEGSDIEQLSDDSAEPSRLCELQWDETVLQQALSDFSRFVKDENLQLFYLRRFCHSSIRELSEDSGLSSDVVRQRVHRTGEAFGQLLRHSGYLCLMHVVPDDLVIA
jgi:RNA polymerase sigma factor (sigma-70 family)